MTWTEGDASARTAERNGARARVETPARLHLGFLDLNGDLGRRFGSIGLSIDGFSTRLSVERAAAFQTLGEEQSRAARLSRRLAERLGVALSERVTVETAIPAHAGLGSGTQLALALGAAFRRLHGRAPDAADDAVWLDRGARSGVGAALFTRGGLVVDAGRGPDTTLPPVIARLDFPADWRVLVLTDAGMLGVHGEAERAAFARLPPFPAATAAEICRRVLMQALPGVIERDLAGFGDAITEIQGMVGDHFAPAQGGGRFTSAAAARVAGRLQALGAVGLGQSSWGPTAFAFAPDDAAARAMAARAEPERDGVAIRICAAVNHGALIERG